MKPYEVFFILYKTLENIHQAFGFFSLQITQSLNFWVRKTCEMKTNTVSIERVFKYEQQQQQQKKEKTVYTPHNQ